MAVRGHEEDAATILRRLLEISGQILYLEKPELNQREALAEAYLAYDPAQKRPWVSFKTAFDSIGRLDTYQSDYKFRSRVAHAAAKRGLPHRLKDGEIQIRSAEFFTPLLLFDCLYFST